MAVVHILQYGLPLCGFSFEVPAKWPTGHLWVRAKDKDKATCPDCIAKADVKKGKKGVKP